MSRAGRHRPRAQAIVAYLTGRLGASHRDVVEAMAVLYGLRLSTGSVSSIQRQVSEALGTPVEEARRFVQQQAAGGRFVGRVLTAVQTLKQQGRDVPAYLAGACRGALSGEVRASLAPDFSCRTT